MIESTKTCCSHVILLYANILITLKITSPHLISPRLTSPHLTLSSHHNSSHLASSHFTSTHRNPLPLTPPHLIPPYLISSHLASPDHLTLISPQLIKLTSNSSVLTLSYFSSTQVVLGSAVVKRVRNMTRFAVGFIIWKLKKKTCFKKPRTQRC